MISSIAPAVAQSFERPEGVAAPARARVAPAVAPERASADRRPVKACAVALAPAAMSALIEAQEHLAEDARPQVRGDTVRKIDDILVRLCDAPAARPVAQARGAGFSLQLLMAARQQLAETIA